MVTERATVIISAARRPDGDFEISWDNHVLIFPAKQAEGLARRILGLNQPSDTAQAAQAVARAAQ